MMMKKILFAICLVLVGINSGFGQAKKPTLMVVPSDNWCIKNGFFFEFNNQGTITKVPDYKRALQESTELTIVISKINGLMADRGFPLKNMESSLKTLESENAENAMLTSKGSGGLIESPVDRLKRVAKADIILQLTWTINKTGPNKSITFILQGLDSYTDKQIAEAGGTGASSFSAEVSILLEEAVLAHLDKFNNSLMAHFDDMFLNGREIIVRIKKFDSWSGDLEREFEGRELSTVIEDWMRANTLKSRYNLTDVTENMMLFEQVRIPLYDANGNAIDARGFLRGLQKHLSASPYLIVNKLTTKGLGQAAIVLGAK
jgi:hypothetical protein